ncbi:MAG: glycosyltransferase [Firmicutes bacterium]|nr:glycosyltransferase [Bacillota bacterium]
MRVLVSGLAADKLGGIETFLLNMNYYMSNNCVFDYVIEGNSCIHKNSIEKKGGEIYLFPSRRSMLLKNILAWRALLKNKKSTIQVVYFNMFSLAYTLPVFVCRYYGYKVIVHAHTNNLHDCGMLLKGLHCFNKQLLKLLNVKRLTNSKLSSGFMFGDPEAGEIIYNAIDVERFKFNAEIRHKLRCQYGLNDKIVFGFAGRLVYEKNPLFLLDIFKEIIKINPSSILMLIGDGDLMPEIKAKIKNYGIDHAVLLLGVCKNVEEFYQAMDVFILPSRFEGLGIALIEAQTVGLPCLTSAEVVPPEAKVTDLLSYVPLKNNPVEWAHKALQKLNSNSHGRLQRYEKIKEGHFNIKKESLRFEKILYDYGQS